VQHHLCFTTRQCTANPGLLGSHCTSTSRHPNMHTPGMPLDCCSRKLLHASSLSYADCSALARARRRSARTARRASLLPIVVTVRNAYWQALILWFSERPKQRIPNCKAVKLLGCHGNLQLLNLKFSVWVRETLSSRGRLRARASPLLPNLPPLLRGRY